MHKITRAFILSCEEKTTSEYPYTIIGAKCVMLCKKNV
jgi:hypothetical protein